MASRFSLRLLGRAGLSTSASPQGRIGLRPGDLVPQLASLIPKLPQCKSIDASNLDWVKSSESFFTKWKQVAPCMPKYAEFLKAHKASGFGRGFLQDVKDMREAQAGKAIKPEAEAPLAEFYLAIALRFRPEAIEEAGSDSQALLEIARRSAEEDFEPFIEHARGLVSDYDPVLHKALEDTCPFYETDEGLFWHANFDAAAPAEFQHYLTALGHGSGQGWTPGQPHTSPERVPKAVEEAWSGLNSDDGTFAPARRAALLVYEKWLQASSMPVKSSILKVLMEHGFLIGKDVYDTDTLMPKMWPASGAEYASPKENSAM